jgi:hypothetical protein
VSVELVDDFVDQARRALCFLTERHVFSEPTTQIDRLTNQVTVTFTKGAIAIEAIYDLHEGDVEIKIARLEKGRRPPGYNVDPQGRRIRASLVEILKARAVRQFGLRSPGVEEAEVTRLERLLGRKAVLLQMHGGDILTGSAEVFELLPKGRVSEVR